jgi:nucleoside-diphosphate-sugar epimerase
MPKLLCCGYGYSARAVCAHLAGAGWALAGTTRTAAKAAEIEADGVTAHIWSAGMAMPAAALGGTTHLLISAAPDAQGDPVLTAIVGAPMPELRWIGYLSTTGVYGDHQGAWVTEESKLRAQSPRSQRRVAAERAWAEWGANRSVAVQIFRLAGIYGPGRSQLDSLRDGSARRIIKPGQVFSRIHVDDIANVVVQGIAHPDVSGAFNVCDDEPSAPADVMTFAAGLIGVAPPPLEEFETAKATMSEMSLSFYADNKRVANEKMKRVLGVRLKFPNYREGLTSIAKG